LIVSFVVILDDEDHKARMVFGYVDVYILILRNKTFYKGNSRSYHIFLPNFSSIQEKKVLINNFYSFVKFMVEI